MTSQVAKRVGVGHPSAAATDLLQQLYDSVDLPEDEIAWHRSLGQIRRLLKGDIFCEIGQSRHEVALVLRGIVQSYTVTSSGDRVVFDLLFPGGILLALDAAARDRPSEVCFEALTPCEIVVWPYELRKTMNRRHPAWAQLETRLTEAAYTRKNRRYITGETLSATERYAYLDVEFPPTWRGVPQHILASYLRITPQHLSRLKRRAAAKSADSENIARGS